MVYETENTLIENAGSSLVGGAAAVVGVLPAGLAIAERGVALVRAYLAANDLPAWPIFFCSHLDLHDLEWFLESLHEQANWEPLPPATTAGEPVDTFTYGDWGSRRWESGILVLRKHQFALARWYWPDPENGGCRSLRLCAAASNDHFVRLHNELLKLRRHEGAKVWQIIRGGHDAPERLPRSSGSTELFFDPNIVNRIDTDVVGFFTPAVQRLYQSLEVPYRRGVLLYGPPGNGKTSLIRRIGQLLPSVPGFILRPSVGFDNDDLEAVVKRWTDQAPAILVIEDLDWLLSEVNVSSFLNILDGIGTVSGGLLLVATTNHPEKLDPAVNNRPGRFDLSLEIPNPDAELREQFFLAKLAMLEQGDRAKVVQQCEGLSFSHLQEILRLSGMLALHERREVRAAGDVHRAVEMVREAHENASRGFPVKLEIPFGLVRRKGRR